MSQCPLCDTELVSYEESNSSWVHCPNEECVGYIKRIGPPIPILKKDEKMHDPVNNPSHYQAEAGGIECIDAIKAALGKEGFITFLRGQVIKYTWRLGKKDASLQDAQKAQWYQNRLVEELK